MSGPVVREPEVRALPGTCSSVSGASSLSFAITFSASSRRPRAIEVPHATHRRGKKPNASEATRTRRSPSHVAPAPGMSAPASSGPRLLWVGLDRFLEGAAGFLVPPIVERLESSVRRHQRRQRIEHTRAFDLLAGLVGPQQRREQDAVQWCAVTEFSSSEIARRNSRSEASKSKSKYMCTNPSDAWGSARSGASVIALLAAALAFGNTSRGAAWLEYRIRTHPPAPRTPRRRSGPHRSPGGIPRRPAADSPRPLVPVVTAPYVGVECLRVDLARGVELRSIVGG